MDKGLEKLLQAWVIGRCQTAFAEKRQNFPSQENLDNLVWIREFLIAAKPHKYWVSGKGLNFDS